MGTHYQGSQEEILALDTYIKFLRALETVKTRIDAATPVRGLSGSQFGTLEMIYHLGPLKQKEIGQKLLISKSNVVTVIDKLEQRGLVSRQRSLEDRRVIFVNLTESGRDLVDTVLPGHVAAITGAFSGLTAVEQKELGRICRKLGLAE